MDIPIIPNVALPDLSFQPTKDKLRSWGEALAFRLSERLNLWSDRGVFNLTVTEFFEEKNIQMPPEDLASFIKGLETALLGDLMGDPLEALAIKKNIISNLEHGKLGKVRGLVLHQTNTPTAKSTMRSWQTRPYGTHFLIDTSGTIYQTARLEKKTWHVGRIQPRCKNEGTCTPAEAQTIRDIEKLPISRGKEATLLSQKEMKKAYPNRYPINNDSIGIEVVGLFDEVKGYGPPTHEQKKSLDLLLIALMEKYNLSEADIYAHGKIGIKQESEGAHMGY